MSVNSYDKFWKKNTNLRLLIKLINFLKECEIFKSLIYMDKSNIFRGIRVKG